MITREHAVRILYHLMNSGLLKQDLEDSLQEIANCIEMEETHGVHAWGADDDDVSLLVVARREDLVTDEYKAQVQAAYDRLKF